MANINIELSDYQSAKDGSLLIKEGGRWRITTFEELNKANKEKFKKLDEIENNYLGLKNATKHFVVYAKSHFLVVFNYFKVKILSGDLDVIDESILRLDESVLNNEVSVEDAIERHPFLKEVYTKLYLNEKEMKTYPEV